VTERDAFARALLPLSRRRFLALVGAAAATGLLAPGCSPARPAWLRPPSGLALRHLSERSYATLAAASARLVGEPGASWIAAGEVAPAATADAWLQATPALAERLAQGLLLLELGTWPLLRKLRTFSTLAPERQDAVLADLAEASLGLKRELFRGLRSLAFLTFYSDPLVRARIGHPGPFGRGAVSIGDAMRDVGLS
jgi:hypothetical protein